MGELIQMLKKFILEHTKGLELGDRFEAPSVFLWNTPIPKNPELTQEMQDLNRRSAILPPVPNYQVLDVDAPDNPDDEYDGLSPYVLIRPLNGRDYVEDDGQLAAQYAVKLLFYVRSESEDGLLDVAHLIEVLRLALLESEWIENRYKVLRPLEWDIPEEQDSPDWGAEMSLTVQVPTIVRKDDFDGW